MSSATRRKTSTISPNPSGMADILALSNAGRDFYREYPGCGTLQPIEIADPEWVVYHARGLTGTLTILRCSLGIIRRRWFSPTPARGYPSTRQTGGYSGAIFRPPRGSPWSPSRRHTHWFSLLSMERIPRIRRALETTCGIRRFESMDLQVTPTFAMHLGESRQASCKGRNSASTTSSTTSTHEMCRTTSPALSLANSFKLCMA